MSDETPKAKVPAFTVDAVAANRRVRMLRTAMGPVIAAALEDPQVTEIALNPDGSLWVDRLSTGRAPLGHSLTPQDAERIVRLVAAHVGREVHPKSPMVSAELPETGERFEGVLPPISRAPAFAIRKPAGHVIPLEQYINDGIIDSREADLLRQAVQQRLNILIAGATSSGKTTLANALLREIAKTNDRVFILEDTIELKCSSRDNVALRTEPGLATLTELVRRTLRMGLDRVVVGEVRGPEALDLLKVWGTGHPGGIATIHAGSAQGALLRLEQLIQEAVVTVPRPLIADTVNVVVFMSGRGALRRVREIVRVIGLDGDGYLLEPFIQT
jgi:type IV secretion system protein VirB11